MGVALEAGNRQHNHCSGSPCTWRATRQRLAMIKKKKKERFQSTNRITLSQQRAHNCTVLLPSPQPSWASQCPSYHQLAGGFLSICLPGPIARSPGAAFPSSTNRQHTLIGTTHHFEKRLFHGMVSSKKRHIRRLFAWRVNSNSTPHSSMF